MSKIVFFNIPAHGHTNPTLGVVRELVSQGHRVWYYSYEAFREKIEEAGAEFIPCDQYDREQNLSPKDAARVGKDLAFSVEILADTTLALEKPVCRDLERLKPDCIAADSMAVWGKAIARKLGIPFVSSTTTFAFNQYSAKIMRQSFKEMASMLISMPKINRQIKRLRDNGYPIKNVLDILANDEDTHTIVYTSPEFQPCSETFSDKYVFVGPSVRPSSEEIRKVRQKLVYISMGTVNNDMLPFYKECIRAFQDTDYQVVMSVGSLVRIEEFGRLPENLSVYSYVDQIGVLKKADVFLTHCGMNSVSESLYFGVPLVMRPQTSEQGGVARRVEQLGAGKMLKGTDAKSVLVAVESVLEDEKYKESAKKIAKGFQKCSGARGAARKILEVCGN